MFRWLCYLSGFVRKLHARWSAAMLRASFLAANKSPQAVPSFSQPTTVSLQWCSQYIIRNCYYTDKYTNEVNNHEPPNDGVEEDEQPEGRRRSDVNGSCNYRARRVRNGDRCGGPSIGVDEAVQGETVQESRRLPSLEQDRRRRTTASISPRTLRLVSS